jgi:glycosyltransferase involved in cell wall biosynthesis
MPALASRVSSMRPLIERQIAGRDDVEFLVELDDGEAPSGAKRQRLLDRARGAYVACVDDDDEVVPDYLREIVPRCRGVDVVTFRLDFIRDGRCRERWRLGLHGDNRRRGRMAANHLCAWRADLARRVSWSPISYGDDQAWYGPLHASGLARREAHIPRTLYRYLYDAGSTVNQRPERIRAAHEHFGDGLRCYRDAAGEIYVAAGRSETRAYHRGRLVEINASELEHFHTVRIA